MIEAVVGTLGSVALLLGLGLATIGLYGMLRHPDVFEQLHAAGLVTGAGTILVLLASVASGDAEIVTSAGLVIAFVLVTSSLSTHVIALAGWRQRAALQATGGDEPRDGRAGPMRVLVADDGLAASGPAIALTAALAWPEGTILRVVGVTEGDLPGLSDIGGRGAEPGAPTAPSASPGEVLAAAARELEGPERTVEHVLRAGDPASAIVEEAESFDAQLIVVGSRGRGRVHAAVAGSVVAGVMDRASCPVLVARTPTVRAVLLAADGSEASRAAAAAVASWPMFKDADVAVLSVAALDGQYRELPPVRTMREATLRSRQRDLAATVARELSAAGRRALPHVRIGEAADQIVAFAEAQDIDLIVIGSRGRTGLTRTLLGSVGRDVLVATSASVLVVRASAGDGRGRVTRG